MRPLTLSKAISAEQSNNACDHNNQRDPRNDLCQRWRPMASAQFVRRAACGLRGPVLIVRPRRAGDLPVLVHVVSQRARVLRLRRTEQPLAISAAAVLPSSYSEWSRHPDLRAFRSSIAPPTDASIYASRNTSRCPPQDSRSGWIRYFLSWRALASPARTSHRSS